MSKQMSERKAGSRQGKFSTTKNKRSCGPLGYYRRECERKHLQTLFYQRPADL